MSKKRINIICIVFVLLLTGLFIYKKNSNLENNVTVMSEYIQGSDIFVPDVVLGAEELNKNILTIEYEDGTVEYAYGYYQVTYLNGEYFGDYDEGLRDGDGDFYFDNGSIYSGEWKEDKISGYGELELDNGASFQGTFVNNKFYKGTITYEKAGNEYTYHVSDGKLTNRINIVFKNRCKYSGTYKNKRLNGKGTMKYKNGDKYKGYFKRGKRSGKGTYKWKNGATYKGRWKNDKMHGKGTYKYAKKCVGKSLKGSFYKNEPKGWLIYTTKKGKKYWTYWEKEKCKKIKRY